MQDEIIKVLPKLKTTGSSSLSNSGFPSGEVGVTGEVGPD